MLGSGPARSTCPASFPERRPLVAAVAGAPSQSSDPPSWPVTTGRRGLQTCFCSESETRTSPRGGQLPRGAGWSRREGKALRGPPAWWLGDGAGRQSWETEPGEGTEVGGGEGPVPLPGVGDQGKPSQASGPAVFTGHTPPQLWPKSGHTGRVPCQQTGKGPGPSTTSGTCQPDGWSEPARLPAGPVTTRC